MLFFCSANLLGKTGVSAFFVGAKMFHFVNWLELIKNNNIMGMIIKKLLTQADSFSEGNISTLSRSLLQSFDLVKTLKTLR